MAQVGPIRGLSVCFCLFAVDQLAVQVIIVSELYVQHGQPAPLVTRRLSGAAL
jgi:hypothetical protein